MLLADDCEVYPDTIQNAILFMEQHPTVGQGALYVQTPSHSCHIPPWHGWMYAQYWIARRDAGEQIGWYDPIYAHAAVDNDFSARMLDAGHGVVAIPGACVKDHDVRDTTHEEATSEAAKGIEMVEAKWQPHAERLSNIWKTQWQAISGPFECSKTHG